MINFRYHIVSITAVFLALGIGTALGSTFLDAPTVDLLNRNIRSAEARIAETRAENQQLTRSNELAQDRDAALLLEGSDRLVGDLLVDQPVLVVVGPGVDEGVAAGAKRMLAATGADLRGTLVLRDPILFDGALDEDLARTVGIESQSTTLLRRAVWGELTAALAAAGAPAPTDDGTGTGAPGAEGTTTTVPTTPGPSTTVPPTTVPPSTVPTTTVPTTIVAPPGDSPEEEASDVPDGTQPEIIDVLADRGYLRIEPAPGRAADDPILETVGYRYVIITGPDASPAQTDVLAGLLPTGNLRDALPAIVVAPTAPVADQEDATDPDLVARVRGDDDLRSSYGTVDDIDAFSGLVAMALSLQDLGKVSPGHYGQGEGAQGMLPAAP